MCKDGGTAIYFFHVLLHVWNTYAYVYIVAKERNDIKDEKGREIGKNKNGKRENSGKNGKACKKRSRENKQWTAEEKNKLRQYVKQGYGIHKISKLLERTYCAVTYRIYALGITGSQSNNSHHKGSRSPSASPPRKNRKLSKHAK